MAEKRTIELEVKDNSKSLKAQLREAQAEVAALADKYGATSIQATNAAKKAAELKDRIADSKSLTDAFNPDAKFKSLTATLSGVAGGFSAVQGAMGLIGVKGEEVQATLLKVQSAMAISQGLQTLGEAKDSFTQLTAVVGEFVTKLFAKTAAETASTTATGVSIAAKQTEAVVTAEATVAQEGLNVAMGMNPIGAMVLALTALTAGIAYYISGAGDAANEQKKLTEQQKEQAKFIAKEGVGFIKLASQLKQSNAGSKERSKLIDEINSKYGTTLKNLSDEASFQAAINSEVKNYIGVLKLKFKAESLNNAMQQNFNKQMEIENEIRRKKIQLADAERQALSGGGYGKVQIKKGEIAELERELEPIKMRFDNYAKSLQLTEEKLDELTDSGHKYVASNNNVASSTSETTDKIKDYAEELNAYMDALEEDRQARITNARDKELQDAANKYERLIGLADKAGQDTTALTDQYEKDIIDIKNKYDNINIANMKTAEDKIWQDEKYRRQLAIDAMIEGEDKNVAIKKLALDQQYVDLQNALDAKLITENEYQSLSYAAYSKYSQDVTNTLENGYEKQIKDEKAAYEQKAELQNKYADIAGQSAELIKALFGKSKAAQKTAIVIESAAGIAKMIIANKLANLGAMATPQAIATSGAAAVPVITANNVSLGLGIAANIAATAKALKEIGAGGSAPGPPSLGGGNNTGNGGGGVVSPNFNVVGNNGINQLAQLQQQPLKAYVVGSDVTTQQALDRNRINNGTL